MLVGAVEEVLRYRDGVDFRIARKCGGVIAELPVDHIPEGLPGTGRGLRSEGPLLTNDDYIDTARDDTRVLDRVSQSLAPVFGTTATGQGDSCNTEFDTEPRIAEAMPPRPRVPTTKRSAAGPRSKSVSAAFALWNDRATAAGGAATTARAWSTVWQNRSRHLADSSANRKASDGSARTGRSHAPTAFTVVWRSVNPSAHANAAPERSDPSTPTTTLASFPSSRAVVGTMTTGQAAR